MSDDDKCNAQCWDDLSPAELRLLIEKEQASIQHLKVTRNELLESLGKHQMVNKDEIFVQKLLNSSLSTLTSPSLSTTRIITNTITHVDKQFDTLTRIERIELNQVVIAQRQPHTKPEKVKEGEESLFFNSPPHIPTGLPAYNPEHDGNLEPFLQQLENNLQIVNLHLNMWNMALAKYTQGSKIASHWVQNNIILPSLSWYEARDLFATHFGSVELQTRLHDKFFKLSHRPKEPVRKVI
ncbi:hypothetical protein QOT17_014618 [Balamuthia mandrillaris]